MSRADELADIVQAGSGGPDFTPMTHPEPTPDPGSPCKAHREAGFVYSVIGCPRCYPEPTPESVERPDWRAIVASVPEADERFDARFRQGYERARQQIISAFEDAATPAATPQADRGDGLRERIEALHPDGQPCVCVAAVLDILDEVGPIGVTHWDSNAAALGDTAPSGLDEELQEAAWNVVGRSPKLRERQSFKRLRSALYRSSALRESADQERTEG